MNIFKDLLEYQINIIKRPGTGDVLLALGYDFASYFSKIYENLYIPLCEGKIKIRIKSIRLPESWPDFAKEIVWFGRRGGKMICNAVKHSQSD